MNVLIYGASNAIAVVIARFLHNAGHTAVMADSEKYSRAFFSRYCMKKYLLRDPLKDRVGFSDDLTCCIQSEAIALIVPTTDEALLDLVESKEVNLDNVMVTFPLDAKKVRSVFDKANLPELCKKAGVKTPATVRVDKSFEITKIDGLEAPFAVKRSAGVAGEGFMKVEKRELLDQALTTARRKSPESDFLVQEYITGSVFGAGGVFDGQKLEHFYSYKFVRRYPGLCGTPTVCRQGSLDAIKTSLETVLNVLQWNGFCQMDFIVDEKSGLPYLIDINPVHWYSMPFSLSEELNCLSYYLGNDRRLPTTKWHPDDLYTTFSFLRELQRILSGGIFGGSRSCDSMGYWRNFKYLRCADFYWDPLPILLAPILKLSRFAMRSR